MNRLFSTSHTEYTGTVAAKVVDCATSTVTSAGTCFLLLSAADVSSTAAANAREIRKFRVETLGMLTAKPFGEVPQSIAFGTTPQALNFRHVSCANCDARNEDFHKNVASRPLSAQPSPTGIQVSIGLYSRHDLIHDPSGYIMNNPIERSIIEKLRLLPPERIIEVEDFVDCVFRANVTGDFTEA